MKIYSFALLFIFSAFTFAQNNHIVKTDDGRRVLLKADFTWEYIDAASPKTPQAKKEVLATTAKNTCNIADGFEEPKLKKSIQNQLKRGRATILHVKKKVAKDYDCTVDDVLLLSVSEQKSKGIYNFCANGERVTYKRIGNTIVEKGKFF